MERMPGHVHTSLPEGEGHYGERLFAEQAIAAADERTHFWFCLSVPGVNEIDAIILHEDIGAFVIEVKGMTIEGVETYDLETCAIRGREKGRHPVKQAHWAMTKLRIFLEDIGVRPPPFFFTTAAFPRINRQSMADRFGASQADGIAGKRMARHYHSLIFSDDLSPGQLLDRLRAIQKDPPAGPVPNRPVPSAKQVREFIEATTGRSDEINATSDRDRASLLTKPGRRVARDTVAQFLTPAQRAPVVLRGFPGTGKTMFLLEIAIAHAEAGRVVLFTCYNKVLGASLRASLQSRDLPKAVADRVLLADVFAIRSGLKDAGLDELKQSFGTVCVDEAQDMGEEHFEFIGELASSTAEWFLADGEGQELYDPASSFLLGARADGIRQQLNRRFRGSSAGQLVAQAVFETELDRSLIPKWVADRPLQTEPETLDVEVRVAGELPVIKLVKRASAGSREEAYAREIETELALLRSLGSPFDLTVMVPRKSGDEIELVRRAIAMVGVECLDQVYDENRRRILPKDHIRLVTIHSARGIESTRALVFGSREHRFAGDRDLPPQRVNRNAGYIAMSRAKHGTRVVMVEGDPVSEFGAFVSDLVSSYQQSI